MNDSTHCRYTDNNYALISAAQGGHADCVQLLLTDHRVDPTVRDDSALRQASARGHLEVVQMLLDDARVTLFDVVIGTSSMHGHVNILKLALAKLAQNEHDKVEPSTWEVEQLRSAMAFGLSFACARGHSEIVKVLLQEKYTNPSTAHDGRQPVTAACANGHTGVVKLLLQDPRVDPSCDNNSAIHGACTVGNATIVKLLLQDARVDPATQNSRGIRKAW
jgi:ankyrin repeat protein